MVAGLQGQCVEAHAGLLPLWDKVSCVLGGLCMLPSACAVTLSKKCSCSLLRCKHLWHAPVA